MKITSIENAKGGYGKNGDQIRTSFKIEGDGRTLSAFTSEALVVGQELDGTITTTEKDGRTYHNVKFGEATHVKNAPATGNVMLEKIFAEVYATRISIQSILQNLQEKGIVSKSDTSPYSLKDEGFNASEIPF